MATLNLRIPDDLKEQITAAATREDRKITSYVIKSLKDAIAIDADSELRIMRDRMILEARDRKAAEPKPPTRTARK